MYKIKTPTSQMGYNMATTKMKKHLKTLATAMLCLAMALLVSCKKNNTEPSGGSTQTVATVTTNDVTEITALSAICGGEVTSENGWAVTQHGVCWGMNPSPTLSDSYTEDGDGIGKFTSKKVDSQKGQICTNHKQKNRSCTSTR